MNTSKEQMDVDDDLVKLPDNLPISSVLAEGARIHTPSDEISDYIYDMSEGGKSGVLCKIYLCV